jgi:hypothetical protein
MQQLRGIVRKYTERWSFQGKRRRCGKVAKGAGGWAEVQKGDQRFEEMSRGAER